MKVSKKKGKYVFNNDGVYFALTYEEAVEMKELILEIIFKQNSIEKSVSRGWSKQNEIN